jgi:hypothetical protein
MEGDERTAYVTRLGERGLAIHSFDGHVLKLTYNPAADHQIELGKAADQDELGQYARRVIADLPDAVQMFPGMERIEVEFGAI